MELKLQCCYNTRQVPLFGDISLFLRLASEIERLWAIDESQEGLSREGYRCEKAWYSLLHSFLCSPSTKKATTCQYVWGNGSFLSKFKWSYFILVHRINFLKQSGLTQIMRLPFAWRQACKQGFTEVEFFNTQRKLIRFLSDLGQCQTSTDFLCCQRCNERDLHKTKRISRQLFLNTSKSRHFC